MQKYLWYMLLLFTVVTGSYFFYGWAQLPQGSRYIYPIDDVYIHLALARNFAEHGAWSINSSGFDSASSSILYTLLLSFLIKVFGDWEYYPLIINLLAGYATVYAVYRYFRDFYGRRELVWALVLLLPFTLLYMTVLLGMEHSIHMLLMALAVYSIHKNTNSNFQKRDFCVLLGLVFLISIIRFESMFFTVSLAFALFLRKNFGRGIAVLATGFLPIMIFGLISEQNGGYFFPNSVMIKGNYPEGGHIFATVWQILKKGLFLNASFYKCLFFPYLIILLDLLRKYKGRTLSDFLTRETLVIAVVSTGILHALFSFLKYRYENYLMLAVLMLIIPVIADYFRDLRKGRLSLSRIVTGGAILAVFAVSAYRFAFHHLPTAQASKGISEQQVEMSRFLGDYYKGEKVVANDIGAISYFSGVQLLDIVGLGSTDIARMKLANKHKTREEFILNNKKYISDYTARNHYKIAVIYPKWFPGNPPSGWIPVASWTIPGNYGPAIRRVVFYALTPEEVKPLQQNLMHFHLNPEVQQWFYRYR